MGKSGPSRMLTTLAMLSLAAVAPTARVDASAAGLGEQVAAKARAMLGKVWIGLPVVDGGQPIGSIVIGFSVARLGAR